MTIRRQKKKAAGKPKRRAKKVKKKATKKKATKKKAAKKKAAKKKTRTASTKSSRTRTKKKASATSTLAKLQSHRGWWKSHTVSTWRVRTSAYS